MAVNSDGSANSSTGAALRAFSAWKPRQCWNLMTWWLRR